MRGGAMDRLPGDIKTRRLTASAGFR